MKRTIILIDGQNLFYSLKSMSILEREISWDNFFKSLLSVEDELIRTYWFRPQKILDTYFTSQNIRNQIVYKKFRSYHNNYKNDPDSLPPNIKDQLESEANQ